MIRVDLMAGCCNALVSDEEIARRQCDLPALRVLPSQSPREQMYPRHTRQLVDGATLDMALKYRRIVERTLHHNF